MTCIADGCAKPRRARGLCAAHYKAFRRSDRFAYRFRPGRPTSERFWNLVRVVGDCWEWDGARDKITGYGLFALYGRTVKAHRFAYEDMVAEIPEGLQIDHLCRNRACVNPWHLEPVTALVNTRRAPEGNAAKTHCPRNHPYDEENTYVTPEGRRQCRACRAQAARRHGQARRTERAA